MTRPILVRQDGTLGPKALEMVETMASEGKTQRSIAAALGIPAKKFEKLLERNKGENEERLAWERGHAAIEQKVADSMLAAGMGTVIEKEEADSETGEKVIVRERHISKVGGAQLIFYAKAQLGWTEKPTGALVNDNRIQITLPGALSMDDYFRGLGIDKPLDFRKDKTKPHPMLKDVTPAALPAPEKKDGP
jgi:hypothetical protein